MSVEKSKILVYDSNQFFFRYFKKVFSDHVFVFFSEEEIDEFILNQFDLIIFIMESPIEFIEFFKLYNKGVPIIFGSFEKKFYNRRHEMETVCDMKLIDMSGTKMDVRDQLKIYLEVICN